MVPNMKKIIFGGFCMLTGVALLWISLTEAIVINSANISPVVSILSAIIIITGFIVGINGLRDE